MSAFGEAWQRAGEQADDFDPADGSYTVEVIDGAAFAGRDGREWAKLVLRVSEGTEAGREFDDFFNLNGEVPLRISRERMLDYGLNEDGVQTLDDLNDRLVELVGITAYISVGHKDGYRNVRCIGTRVPGATDVPAPEEPAQSSFGAAMAAKAETDEIPF